MRANVTREYQEIAAAQFFLQRYHRRLNVCPNVNIFPKKELLTLNNEGYEARMVQLPSRTLQRGQWFTWGTHSGGHIELQNNTGEIVRRVNFPNAAGLGWTAGTFAALTAFTATRPIRISTKYYKLATFSGWFPQQFFQAEYCEGQNLNLVTKALRK